MSSFRKSNPSRRTTFTAGSSSRTPKFYGKRFSEQESEKMTLKERLENRNLYKNDSSDGEEEFRTSEKKEKVYRTPQRRSEASMLNKSGTMDAKRNKSKEKARTIPSQGRSNEFQDHDLAVVSKKRKLRSPTASGRGNGSPARKRHHLFAAGKLMNDDNEVGTKYDRSYPGESQLDEDMNGGRNSNGCGTSGAVAPSSPEKKRFPSDLQIDENYGEYGEHEEECKSDEKDRVYHVNPIEHFKIECEEHGHNSEEEYLLDEDDPLLAVLKLQQSRRKNSSSSRTPKSSSDSRNSLEGMQLSTREEWSLQYDKRSPEFYYGPIAQLKIRQRKLTTLSGKQRADAFLGVGLEPKNNKDIKYAHENFFRGYVASRADSNAFDNFRRVIGQFARFGIATHRLDPETMWDKGELFKIAEVKLLFQGFLEHFYESGTHGTVTNKASHLKTFVNIARDYFKRYPLYETDQVRNLRLDSRMVASGRYCNQMAAENKKKYRASKMTTKEENHRILTGKLITENDFDTFRTEAIAKLEDIMGTIEKEFRKEGSKDLNTKHRTAVNYLSTHDSLLKKWCINFLVLLILFGNGQRNQVYWMLKAPDFADLDNFTSRNREGKVVQALKLGFVAEELEKRPREIRLPYVLLDSKILNHVNFHINYVRPVLHLVAKAKENPLFEHLLLDTRSGMPLNSRLIRVTFSGWIKKLDPEIHLTPMDVRACYATYMIRKYVKTVVQNDGSAHSSFKHLTEEQFLEMLSSVMNTGVEQLRTVYAAATYTAYADQVAQVLEICTPAYKEENNE